jgi:hypothetical protein
MTFDDDITECAKRYAVTFQRRAQRESFHAMVNTLAAIQGAPYSYGSDAIDGQKRAAEYSFNARQLMGLEY